MKTHLFLLHFTMIALRVILFFLGTLKILIYWLLTSIHAVHKSAKLTHCCSVINDLSSLSGSFITFSLYLTSLKCIELSTFFFYLFFLFLGAATEKRKSDLIMTLSDSVGLGSYHKCAFLTSFQVMLMLLVRDPCFKNHCLRD